MNNVCLIGRLTRDVELNTSNSGTNVAKFSLAVNRKFAKQGDEKQADFINIVAFGKTADFVAKYFSKGQQVGITGRIQTGSYDDKEGNRRYTTDVIVDSAYFADSKRESYGDVGGGQAQQQSMPGDDFFSDDGEDNDVPF